VVVGSLIDVMLAGKEIMRGQWEHILNAMLQGVALVRVISQCSYSCNHSIHSSMFFERAANLVTPLQPNNFGDLKGE
jgi:hypothetical protein